MKTNIVLVNMAVVIAIGLSVSGFYRASAYSNLTKYEEAAETKNGILTPVESVQEYALRSATCGQLRLEELTRPIPDDHLVRLHDGDRSVLKKDIRTRLGLTSPADRVRQIYLKFITEEFPQYICSRGYSFGRLYENRDYGGRALVVADFLKPDGSYEHKLNFWLLREKEHWYIYHLDEVENKTGLRPHGSRIDWHSFSRERTVKGPAKARFKARP